MKIDITARNITLSQDLKEFIYERLNKLLKYDNNLKVINVILLKESRAEKVEIIAKSDNNRYITKCHTSIFEKTVSKAISNIITQIRKNKK